MEKKYTVISVNRHSDGTHLICTGVTVDEGNTIEDYLEIAGKKPSEVIIIRWNPKYYPCR